MKLLRGCLLWLVAHALGYAVLTFLLWHALGPVFPPPVDRNVALVLAGLCVLFWGFFFQAYQALKDAWLIRAAARGPGRFRHGRPAVAVGTIRPLGAALTSPFLAQPCVAYEYRILDPDRQTEEGPASYVAGMALAPCEVEGRGGSMRILGWPQIEGFLEESREGSESAGRASELLDSVSFEAVSLARLGSVFQTVREILTDDDGALQKHVKLTEARPDLSRCTFKERVVPVDAAVCALGAFDARRRGLVPALSSGVPLRLLKGDARSAAWQARKKAIRQLVVGVLLLSLTAGATYGVAQALSPSFGEAMLEAARARRIGELRQMIDGGIDVDSRGAGGETPLMLAGSVEVARLLVAYGADVNAADLGGNTPLMAAARKANKQMVEAYLGAGADREATNREGLRARDLVPAGNQEILNLLD
jgi:hypothetical protein